MQHEIIVLVAYLLLETNKNIDYTKLAPTIISKFHSKEILSKDFLNQWFEGKLDDILAHHFLFQRERNEKLKEMVKPFIQYLNADESEGESSESEDGSKSSDSGSSKNSDESSSKSDSEDDN